MKIWLIVLLVALIVYILYSNKSQFTSLNTNKQSILKKCKVPTLNMEQCFWSQYQECPRYNGSYQQCTNNYIPKPNTGNCQCNNRTFEMCPDLYKISEKCYYNNFLEKS
jgi:hypothetical protein